ncbi:MAG: AAA family ATPase [Firmicutes bacterium]|nr:AAA family ATPase [Bacillota bacterium]
MAPRHRELLPVQSARLLLPEPGSPQKKPPAEPPHHTLKDSASQVQAINRELESLIGLAKVKQLIKEIEAFIVIQSWRQEERLAADPLVLHMIFKGNPGSGKTTIARLIARLFKEMGVLQRGHLVEVERADLVGEYIGHTAQKTREQIRRAQGGVLFIDEAYSLIRGGERDFGKECIDTLVRSMEEMKNEFVLILAGYSKEMDRFISSNPGLRSRFPIIIDFPDYSIEELMKIADLMLDARQYCLSGDARKELINCLLNQTQDGNDYHGNARLVRNLIEKGIRRQAVRLMGLSSISREDLVLIRQQDIRGGID